MNEQIKNLINDIKLYLAQPLLLNSEFETIIANLNKIINEEPEAYDEAYILLATIARAQNHLSLIKQPKVKLPPIYFDHKMPDNFLIKEDFPRDMLKLIFKSTNSFSEAALLGRTCKFLYGYFLTNYQLKEFEAIPLRSTRNTLFFHAPEKNPIQFSQLLQNTHSAPNKKNSTFFILKPIPLFKAKKIVGPILLFVAVVLFCHAFLYFQNNSDIKVENEGWQSFKNSEFWSSLLKFSYFLFELILAAVATQRGLVTTISGFSHDRLYGFREVDLSIEKTLNYLDKNTKTNTINEILTIIKLLKQAVSVTSLPKQSNSDVENSREEASAESSQKLKIL